MPLKTLIISTIIVLLPTAILADMMSVGFSETEIRSQPYVSGSKVLKKVPRLTPLSILEKSTDYCKVKDFEGTVGWVHSSLLSNSPAVVVTGDKANVRSGPGTGHGIVFQLSRGDTALLIGTSEKWVAIETPNGQKGWIAEFLVWGE